MSWYMRRAVRLEAHGIRTFRPDRAYQPASQMKSLGCVDSCLVVRKYGLGVATTPVSGDIMKDDTVNCESRKLLCSDGNRPPPQMSQFISDLLTKPYIIGPESQSKISSRIHVPDSSATVRPRTLLDPTRTLVYTLCFDLVRLDGPRGRFLCRNARFNQRCAGVTRRTAFALA
jgi:hypothetical protein